MPSISYLVTAYNEHEELERLLVQLSNIAREEDEIILQLDLTATPEVREVAKNFDCNIDLLLNFPLNGDFATFKNNILDHASKDFRFLIDADETLHPWLAENLVSILEANPDVEMYYVPRINLVNGLTEEHIQKWGWRLDDQNKINFPDFQGRLSRNKSYIKYTGKVHERLEGFKSYACFSTQDEFCLIHIKDISRQIKQNEFYSKL